MAQPRKPLIAGNWKMNLNHLEAIALTQKIAFSLKEEHLTAVEAVVLPPFVDLRSVQTLVDGDRLLIGYGAQDVSPHESGAYTGDISAAMLAKLGCSYVVVGHSERREHHGEDDALVNAKVKAAYRHDDPHAARCPVHSGARGRRADPLRRLGEGEQRRRDRRAARCRRRPRRRRQPGRIRVRDHRAGRSSGACDVTRLRNRYAMRASLTHPN